MKDTKTYETRIVGMTPDLAATLKRQLTWLKVESIRTGMGEPARLLPTAEGAPIHRDHLGGVSRPPLRRAATALPSPT
jgi:hypothetical protein